MIWPAQRMPSTAELTMPPAYPAPSPIGYKPRTETDWRSVPLLMRTGDEVLVSAPMRTASSVMKPFIFLSKRCSPVFNSAVSQSGRYLPTSAGEMPGRYDAGGRSASILPCKKLVTSRPCAEEELIPFPPGHMQKEYPPLPVARLAYDST